MNKNWWESSPLVEEASSNPNTPTGGNWWESSPLYEEPQQQPQQPANPDMNRGKQAGLQAGAGEAALTGLAQGASFGLGDELAGVISAGSQPFDESDEGYLGKPGALVARAFNRGTGLVTGGARLIGDAVGIGDGSATKDYERGRDWTRGAIEGQKEANPLASFGGEMAGVLVPGVGAAKAGLTAARAIPSTYAKAHPYIAGAATAAGDGAAFGALYGAGNATEGNRLSGAVESGALGLGVGGAVGTIAPVASAIKGKVSTVLGRSSNSPAAVAAEGLGAPLPAAIASDSPTVQKAAETIKKIPIIGSPLVKSAQKTAEKLGQKADDIATSLGATNPEMAGRAIRENVTVGWKGKIAEREKKLYDAVDQFVNPQTLTPLEKTRKVAQEIAGDYALQGRSGVGKAVEFIEESLAQANGLPFQGIKKLRTDIGEKLKNKIGLQTSGISETEFKRIYGALSDDLRQAAINGGGEKGLKAYERANKFSSAVKNRMERLQKFVKADTNEGVYNSIIQMAGSKGGADAARLNQLRKTVEPEVWKEVAGTAVEKMAFKRVGDDIVFSPEQFLTEYSKLSPAGKHFLFNASGQGKLAKELSHLATVSGKFKDIAKLANKSSAAVPMFGAGAVTGGTLSGFVSPWISVPLLSSAPVMARVLSKPTTVRATATFLEWLHQAALNPGAKTGILKYLSRGYPAVLKKELGIDIDQKELYQQLGGD